MKGATRRVARPEKIDIVPLPSSFCTPEACMLLQDTHSFLNAWYTCFAFNNVCFLRYSCSHDQSSITNPSQYVSWRFYLQKSFWFWRWALSEKGGAVGETLQTVPNTVSVRSDYPFPFLEVRDPSLYEMSIVLHSHNGQRNALGGFA